MQAQQVRAALPRAWHRTTSRGRDAAHARIKQASGQLRQECCLVTLLCHALGAHTPMQATSVVVVHGLKCFACKHQVSMSTLELPDGEAPVVNVALALQQYFADLLSADVDTE